MYSEIPRPQPAHRSTADPDRHRRTKLGSHVLFWIFFIAALFQTGFFPSAVRPDIGQTFDPGKDVFEDVCEMCHTMQPPGEDAPAMLDVVDHYIERHETVDSVRKAMVSWVGEPTEEHSSLPREYMDRFGLMPDVELPDSEVVAVVNYILKVYENERSETGRNDGNRR